MSDELKPCPFCGAGSFEIKENGKMWSGMKWSEPSSVSVWHWCAPSVGQPSRGIERVGRDRASAIAAWNHRAVLALAASPSTPSAGGVQRSTAELADDICEAVANLSPSSYIAELITAHMLAASPGAPAAEPTDGESQQ